MWTDFCWDEGKKIEKIKFKMTNSKKDRSSEMAKKTQKMHFWPVFELMSDSLTAI